jgi:hypothetical protein
MQKTDDEIAAIAEEVMGGFVGQLITDDLFHRIAAALEAETGCQVACDRSINPDRQINKGIVQANITTPTTVLIAAITPGRTVPQSELR